MLLKTAAALQNSAEARKAQIKTIQRLRGKIGAFGGIWTRDHYLTKVTPHRARLRRQMCVPVKELLLGNKTLTVTPTANGDAAGRFGFVGGEKLHIN